ncbi:MAG: phosphoribosylanthranilate isomerase [Thermoleophilaceae bacterium]
MTRVKICGITRVEDARLAVELGAWALGVVLWPQSPRACDSDDAVAVASELRRDAEVVGVFVNQTLDEVALQADRIGLTLLQLHGDEGPAYCREAARRTGCRVIKAARVRDAAAIRELEPFRTDLHLLDGHVPGTPGGTGATFDWELVRAHRARTPVVLSGGLTAANVGAGVAAVRPFAVDTASGTELSPGRKDPGKLAAFFEAVAVADRAAAAA